MMTSSLPFLLAAVLVSSAARVAAVSYYASRPELQNSNLQDQLKTQRYGPAGDDSLSVAYLPAYAIPDGSPVDPCVTCRPRRTTHICRRNTDSGCPTRPSSTCSTKRCSSTSAGTTKRPCRSTSSSRRPVAAATFLSSTAGDTKKRRPSTSATRVTPNRTRPKRFVSDVS